MRNTTITRFMVEGRKSALLWKEPHQCHPKSILQVFYPQFSFWGSSHQALAIATLTFTTELFSKMFLVAHWETISPERSSFTVLDIFYYLKLPKRICFSLYIQETACGICCSSEKVTPNWDNNKICAMPLGENAQTGDAKAWSSWRCGAHEYVAFISPVISSAGKKKPWYATDDEHQRIPKKSFTSTLMLKSHLFNAHKTFIFSSNLWWLLVTLSNIS